MAERAVVSTNQFRSERGTITTSRPSAGLLVLGGDDRYTLDDTGPADAWFVDDGSGRFRMNDSAVGAARAVALDRFSIFG